MKKRMMRLCSLLMATSLCVGTMILPVNAAAVEIDTELSAFEQEFADPGMEARPYMRWWLSTGSVKEEDLRHQVQIMKKAGIGGLELILLKEKPVVLNSEEWNDEVKIILDEAVKCGIKVDFTLSQGWPVSSTSVVTDIDDERAEQALYFRDVDFQANTDTMEYSSDEFQFPDDEFFDTERPYELIAVTAAKKISAEEADGTAVYDYSSAVNLSDATSGAVVDFSTGSVSWTAPEEGDWSIFYMYRQADGKTVYDTYVVLDHMSKDATEVVIQEWETAMNRDPELKELHEKNTELGGNFFCDSLELANMSKNSVLWTKDMLEEFEERRGYDLTPYLPTIFAPTYFSGAAIMDQSSIYEFSEIGSRVREDFAQTQTEMFTENHLGVLREWSHSLGKELRYQMALNSPFEIQESALAVDITEGGSMSLGGTIDHYRLVSGVPHMRGDDSYSMEMVEGSTAWQFSWTGSDQKSNPDDPETQSDLGFLRYVNRMYVAGVNRSVFHGSSAKITSYDQWIRSVNLDDPDWQPSWPGFTLIGGRRAVGNEWDDKTPLWEVSEEMIAYLSRANLVLQEGQGDIDLAFYRLYYNDHNGINSNGVISIETDVSDLEYAGYSYDYIDPSLLNLANAVTGEKNGQVVLAPNSLDDEWNLDASSEGPSYKALILDQRINQLTEERTASDMPLEIAQKILNYAQDGLPVIIIGEEPTKVSSFLGSYETMEQADQELASVMEELKSLENVKVVESRDDLVDVLVESGIRPDAYSDQASSNLFYHRTTKDAEFYYIYNNSLTENSSQTITFTGDGYPYQMDPWTGSIEPIAEYTRNDDGVTMEISLEPGDTMFIAIAKEGWSSKGPMIYAEESDADSVIYDEVGNIAIRVGEAGIYNVKLSDGKAIAVEAAAAEAPVSLDNWELILHEWGPVEKDENGKWINSDDFVKTVIRDKGPYELDELVPWYEIEGLEHSSGVGEYTTTFTLEKGWEEGQGAILDFTRVSDGMKLYVNGEKIEVNQLTKTIDIGRYVVAGENTIKAEINSTVANTVNGTNDEQTFAFGIIGEVKLIPYIQTAVTVE